MRRPSWELTEEELAEVDRILAGETDRERMSWPPRKCETIVLDDITR
jgi:hypothetical protein